MANIELALYLDLLVLLICTVLLLRYGRLAHSHPAAIYLFFHIYTFTTRLISVQFGSVTLFADWGAQFEPVTHSELARAANLGDLAFIMITAACIKASRDNLRNEAKKPTPPIESTANLNLRHIWHVWAVTFPIGLVGFISLTYWPGGNLISGSLGEWQNSSWISITQTWAGLVLIALIYWYGFKLPLVAPTTLYLLVMAFQGYHRFRVIIPIILLIQIFLDRKNLRWPPFRVTMIIVALMILFFPLKTIGRMVQGGASTTDIVNTVTIIAGEALTGGADDQQFMDQFASALTLTDRAGRFYYGGTYLPVLVMPVPRQWWPDKPGLADHVREFSTPWRPMFETGMITTYLGEAYINFGYIGIIFIPFLLAYWLSRTFFQAYRSSYFSVVRFTYLMVASNLIQVYRDGLLSIVVHTVVNMMPLAVIVLLHYFFPIKQPTDQLSATAGVGNRTLAQQQI